MKTAGFKTTDITFVGTIGGYLWMPSCAAYKHVTKRVSRKSEPFAIEWEGTFRDLLQSVTMAEDGDFSRSAFIEAHLRITRVGHSAAGPVSRVEYVDLNRGDYAGDYFWAADEADEIMLACTPDEED